VQAEWKSKKNNLFLVFFGSPVNSCVSLNQNQQNPCLYCMLLRAFVCRLQAGPVYASITFSCLKPQTAYGFVVQSRKTVKTEGAARAESNLFELCRVATEEEQNSTEGAVQPRKTVKKRKQSQACLNRRQTESHQACLNGRGAKEEERSSTMLRCIRLCCSVLCAIGFLAIAGFFFCFGIIHMDDVMAVGFYL
jgi:hypothetical protein